MFNWKALFIASVFSFIGIGIGAAEEVEAAPPYVLDGYYVEKCGGEGDFSVTADFSDNKLKIFDRENEKTTVTFKNAEGPTSLYCKEMSFRTLSLIGIYTTEGGKIERYYYYVDYGFAVHNQTIYMSSDYPAVKHLKMDNFTTSGNWIGVPRDWFFETVNDEGEHSLAKTYNGNLVWRHDIPNYTMDIEILGIYVVVSSNAGTGSSLDGKQLAVRKTDGIVMARSSTFTLGTGIGFCGTLVCFPVDVGAGYLIGYEIDSGSGTFRIGAVHNVGRKLFGLATTGSDLVALTYEHINGRNQLVPWTAYYTIGNELGNEETHEICNANNVDIYTPLSGVTRFLVAKTGSSGC